MRRFPSVAPMFILAVVCASSPVFAQRGGGHGGGFSSHSAPSFHGGFSGSGSAFRGPASSGFASSPRYGMTAAPHYGFTSAPHYAFGTSPSYRFSPSARYPVSRNSVAGPRFNGQVFRSPGLAARGTSGSI